LGLTRDRVAGGKFLIFINILSAARQIKPTAGTGRRIH
jgi:hypothetical protein